MKFWDSSAIVPLCIDEPNSDIAVKILSEDIAMAVWWGSFIECYSSFARIRRDGILSLEEEGQVRRTLSVLSLAWIEIEPSEDIKNIAARLLLNHPLRAADTLQLAAAIVWADKSVNDHPFVCLDAKLREAAIREGFLVLPKKI
jgi:uncharacterized protein